MNAKLPTARPRPTTSGKILASAIIVLLGLCPTWAHVFLEWDRTTSGLLQIPVMIVAFFFILNVWMEGGK